MILNGEVTGIGRITHTLKYEIMSWIWLIVVYFAGAISGIFAWEKYGTGDQYKGKIKFSQRGRGNTQDTGISAEISPKKAKKTWKERRAEKKAMKELEKSAE